MTLSWSRSNQADGESMRRSILFDRLYNSSHSIRLTGPISRSEISATLFFTLVRATRSSIKIGFKTISEIINAIDVDTKAVPIPERKIDQKPFPIIDAQTWKPIPNTREAYIKNVNHPVDSRKTLPFILPPQIDCRCFMWIACFLRDWME